MGVIESVGTKLFIYDVTPVDKKGEPNYESQLTGLDASDNFQSIGEVIDAGEHTKEYNEVSYVDLKEGRTVKMKGSYNDGGRTIQLAYSKDDDGQKLLREALEKRKRYSFKIEYPSEEGSVSEKDYFTAYVMSISKTVGGADGYLTMSVTLALDEGVVTVP